LVIAGSRQCKAAVAVAALEALEVLARIRENPNVFCRGLAQVSATA
jgi:hypothetical protein